MVAYNLLIINVLYSFKYKDSEREVHYEKYVSPLLPLRHEVTKFRKGLQDK
jgi:hypothetical protein